MCRGGGWKAERGEGVYKYAGWDRNPDVRRSCSSSSTKGPDGLLLGLFLCGQLAVGSRGKRRDGEDQVLNLGGAQFRADLMWEVVEIEKQPRQLEGQGLGPEFLQSERGGAALACGRVCAVPGPVRPGKRGSRTVRGGKLPRTREERRGHRGPNFSKPNSGQTETGAGMAV